MAIFQPSVILRMKIVYFSMTAMAMRAGRRHRITSCATVLLWLFSGGIGPKAGPDGPSTHGVFSIESQSTHPRLLGGRPIHAPCLFGGWFIRAP